MNNQPSHKQFQSIAPLSQKIFTTYMYLLAHPSPPPPPKKKLWHPFYILLCMNAVLFSTLSFMPSTSNLYIADTL